MKATTNRTPGPTVTPRMRKATAAFMRRIAEEKIRAFGLEDTPEEYVRKCQERTK